jgi:hypothetical protein
VALTTRDESAAPIGALAILDAHGVHLSEVDEAELEQRLAANDDVANLSLRTCRCGARLDRFDAYWGHLREVMGKAA